MINKLILNTKAIAQSILLKSNRHKPFVLMYHRVLVDPENEMVPVQPGMYVTRRSFMKQLDYLTKHYNVIKLADLLEMQDKEKESEKHCSITFDDGWIDNYEVVFPVLAERNIPATFFLATNYIGTNKWFWPEEVAYFLLKYSPKTRSAILAQVEIPIEIKQLFVKINPRDTAMLTKLVYNLKLLPTDQLLKIITIVRDSIKYVLPELSLMMSWANVLEMHSSGLADFQPHTHNHQILTMVDIKTVEVEIKRSKDVIERKLNKIVDCFCYPSGRYSDKIIDILRKNNIKYAVTTERGFVDKTTNQYRISRIGMHDSISSNNILFKGVLNMAGLPQTNKPRY